MYYKTALGKYIKPGHFHFNLRLLHFTSTLLKVCCIVSIIYIILFLIPNIAFALQPTHHLRTILLPSQIASPTPTTSSTSSSNSPDQQLISQSQNELLFANTFILLTGLILTFFTLIAAGLVLFGVFEFRRIGELRRELMARERQIPNLERQVEQIEQNIVSERHLFEDRFAQVTTYLEEERKRLAQSSFKTDANQIEEHEQPKKMSEVTSDNLISIHLRLTEDPLTASNLSTVVTALSELHTELWLIQEGRFDDLAGYTQSYNPHFEEEAPLIVTKLSHNSPTWIDLISTVLTASGGFAIIRMIIDDVVQTRLRYKEKEEQLVKKRAEDLLEVVGKYLDMIAPNADAKTRAELAEKILPTLLKLDQVKGLELVKSESSTTHESK